MNESSADGCLPRQEHGIVPTDRDDGIARITMKPENPTSPDGMLDETLREWQVESALPPRFQEQVWQRIARTPTAPELSLGAGLLRLFEIVLPRPKVAFSYIAILLVLGMAAGSWAAQARSHRLTTTLGQRYVQSIDPFQPAATDR
jgi:hypothetical protein